MLYVRYIFSQLVLAQNVALFPGCTGEISLGMRVDVCVEVSETRVQTVRTRVHGHRAGETEAVRLQFMCSMPISIRILGISMHAHTLNPHPSLRLAPQCRDSKGTICKV